jgi:hypothetical protein
MVPVTECSVQGADGLTLGDRDKRDSQGDDSITVYFNEGCNVQF